MEHPAPSFAGVAIPHKARDASDTEIAIVRRETRPARRSQAFYATASQLGGAGMLERALLGRQRAEPG